MSLSSGSGGSIRFWMPSRPAISIAANARYGLHDGSGQRNSRRFAFGLFEYERDAHRRRAVALRVHEVHRRLVARHEPLVRVRRRVREREDRRARASAARRCTSAPCRTGRRSPSRRRTAARRPSTATGAVHARAVVPEDRLRHERDRLAVLPRDVLDDVLVEHELVGHRRAACRSACRSRPGRRCRPRGAAPRSRCRASSSTTISERRSW